MLVIEFGLPSINKLYRDRHMRERSLTVHSLPCATQRKPGANGQPVSVTVPVGATPGSTMTVEVASNSNSSTGELSVVESGGAPAVDLDDKDEDAILDKADKLIDGETGTPGPPDYMCWIIPLPGLGAYECLIALRKVVLLLLPGFRLRDEYTIAQLMLFDSVTSKWSEHETLADWTMMVMLIFGMVHLVLQPYKSWAVSCISEVCISLI